MGLNVSHAPLVPAALAIPSPPPMCVSVCVHTVACLSLSSLLPFPVLSLLHLRPCSGAQTELEFMIFLSAGITMYHHTWLSSFSFLKKKSYEDEVDSKFHPKMQSRQGKN